MELLSRLAAEIEALAVQRARVAVGVDGPDAAGKSTFANRLARLLSVPVMRGSIDDYRRPRHERYRQGPLSPQGYYHDSFDHSAMRRHLVEPFLTDATTVRAARFDQRSSSWITVAMIPVPARAVLLVDGVFLLRPELRDAWALSVYLRVSEDESLRRAAQRDGAMGTSAQIEQRYRRRYLPARALYRAEVDPESIAHVVIDNRDPERPSVLRWRTAGR